MLLGAISAILLGNLLTGKRVKAEIPEQGVIREQVKKKLEQARIFNAASSFYNTKYYQSKLKFKHENKYL